MITYITLCSCKNDSLEPTYMTANPSAYMSSTLDKCCATYFGWNYDACMGDKRGVCVHSLWYPDWEGSHTGCVSDGNEPSYMTNNAVIYLFATLTDCCSKHYIDDYLACVGAGATPHAHLYFPVWGAQDEVCRTGGGQPEYMNYSPSIWLYATLTECCSAYFR